uniref:Uncharacterized protein n=1 Tax=Schistocephalus solidus TaxID=70667 RepID=A0A0X3PIZ9_SCHSO
MFLTALSVALAYVDFQSCGCSAFILVAKQHTTIDYVSAVPASAKFEASETRIAQGTKEHPCEPPIFCIQFYPRKRSFLINRGTFGKQAAVILTPENSNLAKIAVIIVHKDEWFPGLPNVHYVKPIIVSSSYSPPIAVVLDEDIKEIRLLGNISRLESHSHGGGLQIIIPYEPIDGVERKLMRVTGRMDMDTVTFFLKRNKLTTLFQKKVRPS